MDPRDFCRLFFDGPLFDRLSLDQLYLIHVKIEARIRSQEASRYLLGTADQDQLLHGVPPLTEYYTRSIIPSGFGGRVHGKPASIGATIQTQQRLSSSIPPASSHFFPGTFQSQGIGLLGGQDLQLPVEQVSAAQPHQAFLGESAIDNSFFESNFLPLQNCPDPSNSSSFALENDHYSQLDRPAQDSISKFGVSHQYSQPSLTSTFNDDVLPGFRSAESGLGGSREQRLRHVLQSPDTTQARKRAHDGLDDASNIRSLGRTRKKNKFATSSQNDDTNSLRHDGGACTRCARRKEKCSRDPENPNGPCLRCSAVYKTLDGQSQCFWGKVIDMALFREYVEPGRGRRNFELPGVGTGILGPVDASDSEVKSIRLSHDSVPVITLLVRKAKVLDETKIPHSYLPIHQRSWVMVDYPGAVRDVGDFLWRNIQHDIINRITERKPIHFSIFGKAWQLARYEGSILLQNALLVWSGARHIEGGWHLDESEILDLPMNDDGKVPLTEAGMLDWQVSSIIVKHHLKEARESALQTYQNLLGKNLEIRRKHMLELFLANFILLDNCEHQMRHQRKWAGENYSPHWYSPPMEKHVEDTLHTVKTILSTWRMDIKREFMFTPHWDPSRGKRIATFTPKELEFVQGLGKRVEALAKSHNKKDSSAFFNPLFEDWRNYDKEYCFTGQLLVPDGKPFSDSWVQMPRMPKYPPAPQFGPARPST